MKKSLATLAIAIVIAIACGAPVAATMPPGYQPPTDVARHDVYVATARCFVVPAGRVPGIPVTAIMRDDGDAIDAVVQRFADLGMVCLGDITVDVEYLP